MSNWVTFSNYVNSCSGLNAAIFDLTFVATDDAIYKQLEIIRAGKFLVLVSPSNLCHNLETRQGDVCSRSNVRNCKDLLHTFNSLTYLFLARSGSHGSEVLEGCFSR